MDTDSTDPWLTVAEIARELRLTPATIRMWIANDTLQAKRAGKRKWLVRRSELDRMLGSQEPGGAPPAPPADAGEPVPPVPVPDPAPGAAPAPDPAPAPSWPSGKHQIGPQAWQEVPDIPWDTAITWSRQAPPDGWFQMRLQLIARAATIKAAGLMRLDADDLVLWDEAPLDPESGLSHELRPGANRPGPRSLWDQFDAQVRGLAAATEVGRAGAIASALNELAITVHVIAEQLERYHGPDGNWLPHPPERSGGEAPAT